MNICERLGYIDILTDGSTGSHVTCMYVDEKPICSCPAYHYGNHLCKHVKKLAEEYYNMTYKINTNKPIKKFECSVDAVDEMYDDSLFNDCEQINLFGKSGVGKTLFAVQQTCFLASKGYNVLYVDTEGSSGSMFDKWADVFSERFGDEESGTIELRTILKPNDFFRFLGWDASIKPPEKKKSKTDFENHGRLSSSEMEDIIKKKEIDFVVLDSVTAILKDIPTVQQNFPARADAVALILRELNNFMEDYNVGVLTIHHATFNPAAMYASASDVDITGGQMVKYFSKRQIMMDERQKKDVRDYRRLWLVRGEHLPSWSHAAVIKIDNHGMHGVSSDDKAYDNCFTPTEHTKMLD